MKVLKRKPPTLLTLSCGIVIGFLLHRFQAGDQLGNRGNINLSSKAKRSASEYRIVDWNEKKGDHFQAKDHPAGIIKVPLNIASKLWMPPAFDVNSGEFQLESFFLYEIPLEKSQKINQIVKQSLDELRGAELQNSTLRTASNGDQFFVINPFPKEGLILKNKLRESLESEFKDVKDDRGALLAESILKHQLFAGFGENRVELAVENSENGSEVIRVKTFLTTSGGIVSMDWPLGANYATKRFQSLTGKNNIR